MERNGTGDGHGVAVLDAGSGGQESHGRSATGAGPETSESGWRAEQQLSRLLMKTQQRRERLAQVRGRLAAAKDDDEAAWGALDQERALTTRRTGALGRCWGRS